jgi:predicted phosphodiesterase
VIVIRYGVLSDVHGNLHAFQAVVNHLRRVGVDAWLCAGDLVGYGPHPNECVERVAGLGGIVVAGNHDLMALGRLDLGRQNSLVQVSQRWTRSVLTDETLR